MVRTKPASAKVYLEHELLGKSPLKIEKIKEGRYFLTVGLNQYRTIDRHIKISSNQTKIFDEKLSALIGTLSVKSNPPGADVFLDDSGFLGTTPAFKRNLIVGWHRINLKKEGYDHYKGEFKLEYGQEKKIEVILVEKSGELVITTQPGGAMVAIDGKDFGRTPLKQKLSPGEHRLDIKKEGYGKQKSRKFVIEPDKDTVLDIKLLSTHNEVKGMIYISPGEFIMGRDEGDEKERPARRVWVDGFFIDKYEVNNRQYREFVKSTNYRPPAFLYQKRLGEDNKPVVGVSWHDAMAYAKWAGKRLPSEAEWEKAARGLYARKYPWGAIWDMKKANSSELKMMGPTTIGSFPDGASTFGLLDMAGNVWEWAADWFVSNYYSFAPYKNPKGARFGTTRTTRGGSWTEGPRMQTTTARKGVLPTLRTSNIGFRCAMDY